MSRNKQELIINLQLYLTQQQNTLRSKNTFDINFFMPPVLFAIFHGPFVSTSYCLQTISQPVRRKKRHTHTYISTSTVTIVNSMKVDTYHKYRTYLTGKKWTYVFQQLWTGSLKNFETSSGFLGSKLGNTLIYKIYLKLDDMQRPYNFSNPTSDGLLL